jgi:iron complex outermembrane recepter protein
VKTFSLKLNRSRLSAGVASTVLGLSLISAPAMAQEAAEEAASEEIIVTGSRIPQPNLEGVSPVTSLTGADIKAAGITRVEDLLNRLPQVFGGQTGGQSNASDGTATVDLRGLGSTRTLVLVNGRRMMPGDPLSSAADLNAIPESIVKRVEVLTGGASSTYGADAVAGVVNFIMDRDFKGLRLDAQYSFYQHNNRNKVLPPLLDARAAAGGKPFTYPVGSVADGGTFSASMAMGTGFADDKGHITAYASYRKVSAVLQARRDYSACTLQNASKTAIQCGGSSTSAPGNFLLYDNGTSTFYQVGPNRTLNPGRTRYNFAPTNYYQRPDERYTAGFFADYEISDAIKPYAEFMFMDDRSVAQIAPSGNFGSTLTVNSDNPLISAQQRGIIFSQQNLVNGVLGTYPLTLVSNPATVFQRGPDGKILKANGAQLIVSTPAPTNFIDPTTGATYNRGFLQIFRRNIEGGPRQSDLQHTSYRAILGTKGELGKAWNYDAYYQYGRTNYSQVYTNDVSVARLTKAVDVVAGPGGTPICRSVRDGTDSTCVPYDIFSGVISPGAASYISIPGFQRGVVSQQVASVAFTGKLEEYGIKSPLADSGVGVAIGLEYRKDSLDYDTDQAFRSGDLAGQGAPSLPISGSYNVKEFFAEAAVPLINDGFIYNLSLSGGYRYSKYSTSSDRKFSTNTFKFGAELAPIKDIRFRASYDRAVRAPNLQELFQPLFVALGGNVDPCAGITLAATDVGCLAQGLRIGQRVAANPAAQYNTFQGGNPNLTPEKATTKSFGVILEPSFLPRFSLTVDYFDINVKNAIQGFGADAIVTECTTNPSVAVCSLIKRNPVSGSLWLTNDGFTIDLQQNIGGVKTTGIDVNGNYSLPVGGLGTVGLSFVGTYIDKFVVDNGLTTAYNCAGLYGPNCSDLSKTPSAPSPKWRHNARLSLNTAGGMGFSLQWRYVNGVKYEALAPASNPLSVPGAGDYRFSSIAAQNYFDLSTTMRFADKFTFRLGVNNILDRQPPLVSSGNPANSENNGCATGCNGNTFPSVYDPLGRYIYAGVTLDL